MNRRTLLVWLSIFFSGALWASNSTQPQYVLPQKNLNLLPIQHRPAIVEPFYDDLVKVSLSEKQIDLLSQKIHKATHACGGFAELDPKDETLKSDLFLADLDNKTSNLFDDRKIQYQEATKAFINQINKTRYMNFISDMSSFSDRHARSQNGQQASEWIQNKVNDWKKQYKRDSLTITPIATPGYLQKSVVITLPGLESQESIVIGAHMDTLSFNKPGADDDASGSSALLEILQNVLETQSTFKKTVHLIFYAAEEVGLVGSRYVVDHFLKNGLNVSAVMQLDMIGYEHPNAQNKIHFVRDYTNDSLTLFTKKLAMTYLGKTTSQVGDLRCNYACSDHARWSSKGFPAVFPFETSFSDHNPDIHTGRDSINTVSPDHALQFVRLASAFMFELSEPL